MEFFRVRNLIRPRRNPDPGPDPDREISDENVEALPADLSSEDDDDDDFIEREVRRLKELRKNNFMVLIPEETYLEEEEEQEEEETSSSEWRDSEVGDRYPWCGFDALYDKYCERMLFFDKMRPLPLQREGSVNSTIQSPKSASKKLALTLRSLSFKKRTESNEDCEQLSQLHEDDPHQVMETTYVAQVALTWEALHCQYMQLIQKISSQPENPTSYNYAAQTFQQFQVLLQRFIENEPFEEGSRVEIYARARSLLPKLLQVPRFQGMDTKENEEDDLDPPILASDLKRIMEDSILTFRHFLKMDQQKSGSTLRLFKGHDQTGGSLQQVQTSLDKKGMKLKELSKKKGRKKKSWPATTEETELLFGLVDIKVVSRVLKMAKLTNEQLLWCEEKMSKLDLTHNKLCRDGSPILFPC